ncbi:dienelactone hydrolase family protein [Sphingomonas radiodurans]|uniref:dienelactone hydrolase family protein n=1 Tax=Sphingomonas radiodurans TaxID=2890321 RepID=UPI001E5E931B|nr:dienelactone hydrolase family protein [Sphingomonas radiodurans]WBH17363.1 dienelactone hydrolase family protein [Sphingomonas radiodurans]
MTDPSLRDRAVQLYDAFTHEHRDRRTLLRQMTALAGSVVAAETLIAGIAASPAAAAIIDPADKRLDAGMRTGTEAGKPARAYFASLKGGKSKRGVVLVVHENRGLTPHIQDVARRMALEGFIAIAPDLLAPQGGTPADEDAARTLIGTVDYDLALAQARSFADKARRLPRSSGKVGIIGFCWGGAFVNRMAVAGGVDAGVSYYGPAPAPAEATKVTVPLVLQLAGKDTRVAQTAEPWVAALKAAGKPVEAFIYPGVDHAFNNDTAGVRYDKAAADLAWGRTTAFLHKRLDA